MSENLVLQERHGGVAIVTMNRPEKHNALNGALRCAFLGALNAIAADSAVRVLVLTGAGPKAFVSGADVAEMAARSAAEQRRVMAGPSVYEALWRFEKPVIAAVNGYCLGGGLELAIACDVRIASSSARFGQPEIALGLIPGGGATQRLPRLIGPGAAARLILTGDPIDAAEALRIGLMDEVVAPDELMPRARELARAIARRSPHALAAAKQALRTAAATPIDAGLRVEASLFQLCFSSMDGAEGMEAHLEKRPATFVGRQIKVSSPRNPADRP